MEPSVAISFAGGHCPCQGPTIPCGTTKERAERKQSGARRTLLARPTFVRRAFAHGKPRTRALRRTASFVGGPMPGAAGPRLAGRTRGAARCRMPFPAPPVAGPASFLRPGAHPPCLECPAPAPWAPGAAPAALAADCRRCRGAPAALHGPQGRGRAAAGAPLRPCCWRWRRETDVGSPGTPCRRARLCVHAEAFYTPPHDPVLRTPAPARRARAQSVAAGGSAWRAGDSWTVGCTPRGGLRGPVPPGLPLHWCTANGELVTRKCKGMKCLFETMTEPLRPVICEPGTWLWVSWNTAVGSGRDACTLHRAGACRAGPKRRATGGGRHVNVQAQACSACARWSGETAARSAACSRRGGRARKRRQRGAAVARWAAGGMMRAHKGAGPGGGARRPEQAGALACSEQKRAGKQAWVSAGSGANVQSSNPGCTGIHV